MIGRARKLVRLVCAGFALTAFPVATAAAPTCKPADGQAIVASPAGGAIAVRTIGTGRPVLMIPSLGRGAFDFDDVAGKMARKGWMVILPDPMGIGGSTGPKPASLFDLAQEVASVVEPCAMARSTLSAMPLVTGWRAHWRQRIRPVSGASPCLQAGAR